ncbi:MAG: hypothetical protein M3Q44_03830 [bacterium]|nr:hypothetical protein [bacterium]
MKSRNFFGWQRLILTIIMLVAVLAVPVHASAGLSEPEGCTSYASLDGIAAQTTTMTAGACFQVTEDAGSYWIKINKIVVGNKGRTVTLGVQIKTESVGRNYSALLRTTAIRNSYGWVLNFSKQLNGARSIKIVFFRQQQSVKIYFP